MTPIEPVKILGASSDYLIVSPNEVNHKFHVGQNIHFRLNYSALMHLTVSPYVDKKYIEKKGVIKTLFLESEYLSSSEVLTHNPKLPLTEKKNMND
jgi:hypothetical protein